MTRDHLTQRQIEDFDKNNGVNFADLDKKLFKVTGAHIDETEQLSSKPYSYWKSVGNLLLKSPTFIIAIVLILAIIIAMFAIAPPGTVLIPLAEERPGFIEQGFNGPMAPSWKYPFGLGLEGEDFLKVMWAATRTTLLFALAITAIQVVVGVLIGSIWGYFKKTDIFILQIANFLSLIPLMIFILFILFIFNSKSLGVLILAISLQLWISIAAITRIQVILVKNTDYNTASIFLGSSGARIIFKNIMPRILPVIAQQASLAIPAAIGLDATVTFLGFGYIDVTSSTQTSLGKVLTDVLNGSSYKIYPHLIIFPVIMITLIALLFYLVGKVFSDSLDPKNHR